MASAHFGFDQNFGSPSNVLGALFTQKSTSHNLKASEGAEGIVLCPGTMVKVEPEMSWAFHFKNQSNFRNLNCTKPITWVPSASSSAGSSRNSSVQLHLLLMVSFCPPAWMFGLIKWCLCITFMWNQLASIMEWLVDGSEKVVSYVWSAGSYVEQDK